VYRIGTRSVSLNASNNTTTTVQLTDVLADDNGAVTFTVSLGPTATFAYLNSVVIKGYYQAPTLTQAALSNSSVATAVLLDEEVREDSTTGAAGVYPNPFTSELVLKVPLTQPTPRLQVQAEQCGGSCGGHLYLPQPAQGCCGSSACPWMSKQKPVCTSFTSPACLTTKPLN
jgi:hypothetical protein